MSPARHSSLSTGLTLGQPRAGYRFSLDPFLLAAFVRLRRRERVLDLGAGVGVIALLLARRDPTLRVFALELQEDLARHALANARGNGLDDRCFVIRGDLRAAPDFLPPGRFDRIVANPPYRPPRAGKVSPDPSRALARQELGFTFSELARVASVLLRQGGAFDFIHLAERIPELFQTVAEHGLEPKLLRLIAPAPGRPPRLCLVSARKGGRPGLDILPQLAVHDAPGRTSPEVAAALAVAAGRRSR